MIPGIVLAAGDSSRMRRPKALLPADLGAAGYGAAGHGAESFLGRITRVLGEAGIEEIIVVLGRDADAVRNALSDRRPQVRLIENPDYQQGQLSSLLAGLAAADRPGVRAVLVTPVDVPLLSAGTVRAILEAYRATPSARIVRPAKDGRHGHPVIFDRALFQELRHADPQAGARSVVHAHGADVLNVEVSDEGAFIDIDTMADYERFIGSRARLPSEQG
jgi:molybdenum cofactor cytidylyltransferase